MNDTILTSSDGPTGPDISRHEIGWEHIITYQPVKGYRMAIDTLLLAWFARQYAQGHVVELGCGPAFVSLSCANDPRVERVTGIDIDTDMIVLAGRSAAANRLDTKTCFLARDIRQMKDAGTPGSASLVAMNPPYRKPGTGKTSPVPGRAASNHELTASLHDFIAAASWLLMNKRSMVAVFLSERLAEFLSLCRELKLEPKNIRFVHAHAPQKSKIFLLRAVKNGHPGLTVETPLVLYDSPGTYTPEVQAIIGR